MSIKDTRPILIVEDSDEDFEAIAWAFKRSTIEIPLIRFKDGDQAIEYLQGSGESGEARRDTARLPAIVLLDLNMRRTDGKEVLAHIKSSERLRLVPVVVVTSSSTNRSVEMCYRMGANSYVVKPGNMQKLRELVESLAEYWFRLVRLPELTESHGD